MKPTDPTADLPPILGQDHALRLLAALQARERLPHALLFNGPAGVGKRTTARRFAMALNCRRPGESPPGNRPAPCGRCRPCRKIRAGTHPDAVEIKPSGAYIRIAQIRELLDILAMKPYEARRRTVLIGEAHRMNPSAGNALLKMLEEPPPHTAIVLTAPQAGDLLPTIVSRCQRIRFRPLAPEVIAGLLVEAHDTPAEDARLLAAMAGGSLGRAIGMRGDWLARRRWLVEELSRLEDRPLNLLLALANRLAADRAGLPAAFDVMKAWLRDLAVQPFAPDKIINRDLTDTIQYVSRKDGSAAINARFDAVLAAERGLAANANPRLTMEALVLHLAETSAR